MKFDWTINIPALLSLGAFVYFFMRREIIDREYPPHRHENGRIRYPKGYEPSKAEDLK